MDDSKRTHTARTHDDRELIEGIEEAPSQSGVSGGNLQRDIANRAEEEHDVEGKAGVTRVHKSDEMKEAERSRQSDR